MLPPLQQNMAAHHTSYEPLSTNGHGAVAMRSKLYMWDGSVGSKEKTTQGVEALDISKELWE